MVKLTEMLGQNWESKFGAVPQGVYKCEAVKGECTETKNGTPEYLVSWKIVEGEYKGRMLWDNWYLTQNNAQRLRRNLAAFEIPFDTDLETLELPSVIANVQVVAKEDGQFNDVKGFKIIERITNPFPPTPHTEAAPPPTSEDEVLEDDEFLNDLLNDTVEEINPEPIHAPDEYPEYVQQVSAVIPKDKAITLEDIQKATGLNLTWIQQSLEHLKQLGLLCIVFNASPIYQWVNERPTIKTYPHVPEMSADEFAKEIRGISE